MTRTVAILGESARIQGYALAGARVLAADDAAEVRARWSALPPDVLVVVLTPAAADAIGAEVTASAAGPLTVVMPA